MVQKLQNSLNRKTIFTRELPPNGTEMKPSKKATKTVKIVQKKNTLWILLPISLQKNKNALPQTQRWIVRFRRKAQGVPPLALFTLTSMSL